VDTAFQRSHRRNAYARSICGVLSRCKTFDKNLKVPSIYNWSFGIQQNMGLGTVLDVSYVGNTNRHIESTTT